MVAGVTGLPVVLCPAHVALHRMGLEPEPAPTLSLSMEEMLALATTRNTLVMWERNAWVKAAFYFQ